MTRSRIPTALLGGISILSVTAAAAQDSGTTDLGTIVLYGDRSSVDVDDSTASVTVIGEDELEKPALSQWRDVFDRTPNLGDGDLNESGFTIRGVNSEGLTPGGAGAPVASVYVDGVQQTVEGTRRGIRGTFDMQQIEIYRGPQSTLSGRNALAGAIYMRTRDPEFERSGHFQLTYGEDNKRQAGLAFGDALSDTLAYRVRAEWSEKDSDLAYPTYANYARYDDFVTDDYYSIGGKLLWQPAGNADTRVLFSYSHSYDGPTYSEVYGAGWYPGIPFGMSYGAGRGDGWGVFEASFPFLPAAAQSAILAQVGAPFYAPGMFASQQEVRETHVDNVGLEISHDLSANLKFTALTGFSKSVTERHSINEGTPGETSYTDGEFEQRILSQELRFNYESDALRWVAGVYAAREEVEAFRDVYFAGFPSNNRNTADVTNLAAFGEVSYAFSPQWRVIAGGRVEHYRQEQTALSGGVAVPDTSYEDTSFIPKAGIVYEPNADHSFSLVYQQGYRPGGAVFQVNPGQLISYDPEKSHNVELNWRGYFMQDRLRLNASLFHQNWKSQQVEIWQNPTDPTTSYITNAGKSVSYGAELEMQYAATDQLDLFGSVGLLHTEFETFAIGATSYAGRSFPLAPEATIALGFSWSEGETGWFANGAARYTGERSSRIENGVAAPVMLDGYTVVDASFGYTFENDITLTAYATNLFDKDYAQYEYAPGGVSASKWQGAGREIGIRLDYRF